MRQYRGTPITTSEGDADVVFIFGRGPSVLDRALVEAISGNARAAHDAAQSAFAALSVALDEDTHGPVAYRKITEAYETLRAYVEGS